MVFASLKLGRAFGIDVLMHWSFVLLAPLLVWLAWANGDSLAQFAIRLVLLLVILGSVLCHEIGHALAARNYSIPTRDIMLTPLCGLARLEGRPRTRWEEFVIAISGPATNLAIAVFFGSIALSTGAELGLPHDLFVDSLWSAITWINLLLCFVNLLPVFPMDGGRVFRALLAGMMDQHSATLVAVRIGQVLSLAAICVGAYYRLWVVAIIGTFLFLAAQAELSSIRRARSEGR